MNNKYKNLFLDSIAFMASTFASKILIFFLIPLYTYVLSVEEYGRVDLITNTVNVLYPILTLCIMEATLRFACDKTTDKDNVLGNSIAVIIISELLIILFDIITFILLKKIDYYWIGFTIIFFCFNFHEVISQFTKGIGKTKIYALSGVIHTIVIIVCNLIGLLYLKLGVTAYLASIIIGYIITSIFLIFFAKIKIKIHCDKKLLVEMIKYSMPLIPTTIAWWISMSADKYIIILYHGIAMSGIYSIAYKVPSILTLFTNIFSSAWTISVIKNVNDDDNAAYQSNTYKYFNGFNILICSLLIIMSKLIGKVLFAKDFFVAWKCVPFLLIAYLFAGLSGFIASSFRAAKKTKYLLISSIIGSIVNIVLNIVVIKWYGMIGAAITTIIGFAIIYYIRVVLIKKIVNLNINLWKDSTIFVLLLIQAFIISYEIKFNLIIGTLLLIIINAFYFKDLISLLKTILLIIKRKRINIT